MYISTAYQYLSIAFTVNLAYLSLHSSGIWSVTVSSVYEPSTLLIPSLLLSWSLHHLSSLPPILPLSSFYLPHSCYFLLHCLSRSLLSPNLHNHFSSHALPSVPHTPFLWSVLYHTWADTAQHEIHRASGPAVSEPKRNCETVKTVATYIQVWKGCSYKRSSIAVH